MPRNHFPERARPTNIVNLKIDKQCKLVDIEGVDKRWEESHRIRALVIDGKSPVCDQLAKWKTSEQPDYKKIMKVMALVARQKRVINEMHVTSDGARSGIREMRAHRGHARVLFFYDDDSCETVICVHACWKGRGDQSRAFDLAAEMMRLWKSRKHL
jgi:putative component of toxin-antitoxin plasmid stabilization module